MVTVSVGAQDYTHPRDMGLPKSGFERPNPNDYRLTLENGLVAYVVEDHRVPLATITAFIGAGTAADKKPGAAEALAQGLRSGGISGMDAKDFKVRLRNMVADFRVAMGPEITTIRLNVPVEDGWQALELLAGLLKKGRFNQSTIDDLIKSAKTKANPSESATGESGPVLYEGSLTTAVERFKALLFAGHPYGQAPGKEDYKKLKIGDIESFYSTHVVPGNSVIALSGDFDAELAKNKLAENFADWQSRPVPARKEPVELKAPTERRVYTYPSDKLQAWIVMGHELPVVPPEDQVALQVMNYILGGGHFDTRLFRETRDKRGLTNDDSGFLELNWYGPGSYTFRTYGRPEVIHLLAELTLKEIHRIRAELVSEQELFVAKNALAEGVFQMGFENGHATALTFAEEWLRFGNHEASASYVKRVQELTVEDVLAAAKKYLHPERMQMVLMGPVKKVLSSSYPEGDFRVQQFGEMVAGK